MIAPKTPLVSVIMANFNGGRFLADALASVTAQSLRDIEVIVIDDASTDNSCEMVQQAAASDARIRLLTSTENRGPAGARNAGLDAARGDWIAIMDSDDLIHPDRLANLLQAAERDGADIVADNLMMFHDGAAAPPSRFLTVTDAAWIDAVRYIRSNQLFVNAGPPLGYLKPFIRAARIGGRRYDTHLRIAEDYYFTLGLLLAGARFRLLPDITYFYRRHQSSISHRLSARTLQPMLQADAALRPTLQNPDPEIIAALDAVRRTVETALAFDGLVTALKQRRPLRALRLAFANPRGAALLRQPVIDRARRLVTPRPPAPKPHQSTRRPRICLLSRQRVTDATSGSSVYLLSLCAALRDRGHELHLLCPSPAMFGRWPWLRFGAGADVFASITLRGAWRVGPYFVARDPRIALRALLTVLDRLGARAGLGGGNRITPAPYAVAVPWTVQDKLFVARHAPPLADFILADYAFLTEGIAYALRPDAGNAVIMHDLFSSRAEQFNKAGGTKPLLMITLAEELSLLARAQAIVAIQATEAAIIAEHLPHRRVITAPIAASPATAPQPGEGETLLFIGSNAAPNATGLAWFAEAVWPLIRAAVPHATLTIAGAVADAFIGQAPVEAFRFLGPVADLAPLYRDAAVMISPLRAGSGLKIKLIEALSHGKAMVATPVSVQGVETEVADAVHVADAPADFAAAVLAFLAEPERRRTAGQAALSVVARHFSVEACYGEFLAFAAGADV